MMNRTTGVPGFDTAKLSFGENLQQFIDPNREPALNNLNKGLYRLVMGLEMLEAKIDALRSEVNRK